MNFKVFLICFHITLYYQVLCALPTVRDSMDDQQSEYTVENYQQQPHGVIDTIQYCFKQEEISRCFKKQMIQTLDDAIVDNGTWHLSDYLIIEKDQNWTSSSNTEDNNNLTDVLANKVRDLAESRTIRLRMDPLIPEEGRKKKDKGGDKGGYAMIGGMAMMGMMAQMFMGKVVMLAGAAFVIAKIALFFSVFSGLKKSTGSSGGGGGTDTHVVYADSGGHGHGHSSGWQRSVPRHHSSHEHAYSAHGHGHYAEEETP